MSKKPKPMPKGKGGTAGKNQMMPIKTGGKKAY